MPIISGHGHNRPSKDDVIKRLRSERDELKEMHADLRSAIESQAGALARLQDAMRERVEDFERLHDRLETLEAKPAPPLHDGAKAGDAASVVARMVRLEKSVQTLARKLDDRH